METFIGYTIAAIALGLFLNWLYAKIQAAKAGREVSVRNPFGAGGPKSPFYVQYHK